MGRGLALAYRTVGGYYVAEGEQTDSLSFLDHWVRQAGFEPALQARQA